VIMRNVTAAARSNSSQLACLDSATNLKVKVTSQLAAWAPGWPT